MDVIQRIEEKLAGYPQVNYSRTTDSLTVDGVRPSGFKVALHASSDGFYVEFDGLHEQFGSQEEEGAVQFFGFGLSDSCRLAITYRGSVATRWVVEAEQTDGSWNRVTEMGLLLFPFWSRKRVEYKQNHWIPVD